MSEMKEHGDPGGCTEGTMLGRAKGLRGESGMRGEVGVGGRGSGERGVGDFGVCGGLGGGEPGILVSTGVLGFVLLFSSDGSSGGGCSVW